MLSSEKVIRTESSLIPKDGFSNSGLRLMEWKGESIVQYEKLAILAILLSALDLFFG